VSFFHRLRAGRGTKETILSQRKALTAPSPRSLSPAGGTRERGVGDAAPTYAGGTKDEGRIKI
jgi:hypothetical protein